MKTPFEGKVTPAQSSPFYFVCVGVGLYRWFVALGHLVSDLDVDGLGDSVGDALGGILLLKGLRQPLYFYYLRPALLLLHFRNDGRDRRREDVVEVEGPRLDVDLLLLGSRSSRPTFSRAVHGVAAHRRQEAQVAHAGSG